MVRAKHGFTLAFYYLLRTDIPDKDLFDLSQRETISLGGDTDTNCCIVGGMLGAYLGLSLIDPVKIRKVTECDLTAGQQQERPDFCQP